MSYFSFTTTRNNNMADARTCEVRATVKRLKVKLSLCLSKYRAVEVYTMLN
jgi:hypothetical protein